MTLLRRVTLSLGVLLALAIVGELTLRIAPSLSPEYRARSRIHRLQPTRTAVTRLIKKQQVAGGETYAPDPELGALLAPFRNDTEPTPDYTYVRQTDHAGFANRDPWPDHLDIAVLGSSLVMGAGVGIDSQFTTLLADTLGGPTLLNFGVPGAGSEMEYRIATRFVAPRRPPLVILAIWVGSDLDNNREFVHWLREKSAQGFTEYRFAYGDTHPDIPVARPLHDIVQHSSLWRAAEYTTEALLVRQHMRERAVFADNDTIYLSVRLQHQLAEGIDRGDTPDMRQTCFEPLERLQHRIESRGGHFLVVLLPSKEEIYGAEAFPAVLNTIEQTRAELDARKIPTMDLYDLFRRQGRTVSPFFPTDIHYNHYGNRLIADTLAAWIAQHRIFTPDPS